VNSLTTADLDFVARTVMAEAEGEPYEGKVAVAAVIYNRARNPRWWGSTVIDVCLTSKQFSCWNDNNLRRRKIGIWDSESRVFRDCMRAALEGFDRDPTGGADSYYAHGVVFPDWADGLTATAVIGKHTFVKTL